MDYRVEDLKLMKMKKIPVCQPRPYLRDGLTVYEIEKTISLEEKVDFIDSMHDGIATYLLNLLEKWEREKDTLPKDSYGVVKKVSYRAWLRRNDKRKIIDTVVKVGAYYMFGTRFTEMSLTCPTGEFGYSLEYTGDHIAHQWFHDLLKELEREERKYFREHDSFQQKLQKVKKYGERYQENFGCIELNNIIWNGLEDVPEERLDKYLVAYQQLETTIEKISQELKALG